MRATAIVVSLSLFSTALGAPNYLPLKEGNYWIFLMSNGLQTTTTVTGFEDVGAVRCAIVETMIGPQSSREYIAVDAEGAKTYKTQAQGQELVYDPPVMRIKLPYQEGDTWTATLNQGGMTLTTDFQSLKKERIRTQAGLFDCIKIRSTVNAGPSQPQVVSISYYADGVGPVQQIMQMAGQEITASLVATNVKPTAQTEAAPTPAPAAKPTPQVQAQPKPQAAGKVRCPKCGAEVDASAKFCPECGQKMAAPAPATEPNRPAAPAAGTAALERYQSPDGKVLLFKPKGWNVDQGNMFGAGTYAVTVMEPQENAVVLFITFPVGPDLTDSVALAAKCIAGLRAKYPDLQANNIQSTPKRERTLTDLTLTDAGEKGTGHGYFFLTGNTGSVYILLAKAKLWDQLRPVLTTVAANLAYTPQGVAAVQAQAKQAATQTPAVEGPSNSIVATIKRALQLPGKQVPLQPAALPDQSLSLQIPQGWTLEGAKIQYVAVNSPETRAYGWGSLFQTVIPSQFSMPGIITTTYQQPPQALKTVLENGRSTRDVQTIDQCPVLEIVPELRQYIEQMQGQGFQVDARLIHAKFRNVPTGQTCRGIFCVICSIKSISPVWQVSVQGSWAPDKEYDEWLPVFWQLEKTVKVNQQWLGQEMQAQVARQQQLNRSLQKSIAESQKAFEGYMGAVREGERSRDYTSHMWSQTTLGQGSWVAQSEGAKVYQTDSWGIEGPEGRIDSPAYNTANFDGVNPWTGGHVELVNTRAEYEKYIAKTGSQ